MKYYIFILIFTGNIMFAKEHKADIDYTIFYLNNDSISVEFYYEINSKDLDYLKITGMYYCNIVFEAEVKSLLYNSKFVWELNSKESDLSNEKLIFGTHSITLPKDQYDIKIKYFQDNEPDNFKEFKTKVYPKNNKDLFLSNAYFASIIVSQDSSNINWDKQFLKANKYIIPNASKQYFSSTSELLFYHEVYNSKSNCDSEYTIEYKVIDAVKKAKSVLLKKSSELSDKPIIETQSIPIPNLATGVYYINIAIYSDNNKKAIDEVNQKFFYLNFNKEPELNVRFTENELFERSEFITFDEETLKREFDKLKFIMSKADLSIWDNLHDLKAKQRALFTYWRSKDKDTSTYFNEAKEEFDRAVNYANTYFQYSPSIEGWRTDRGRVLLKYGFPMLVEKFPRKGELIPCEIWYYGEAGGGAYFYFVDNGGYHNMILVHSTLFGENQNEYWIEEFHPAVNFDQNIKRSSNYFK